MRQCRGARVTFHRLRTAYVGRDRDAGAAFQ